MFQYRNNIETSDIFGTQYCIGRIIFSDLVRLSRSFIGLVITIVTTLKAIMRGRRGGARAFIGCLLVIDFH